MATPGYLGIDPSTVWGAGGWLPGVPTPTMDPVLQDTGYIDPGTDPGAGFGSTGFLNSSANADSYQTPPILPDGGPSDWLINGITGQMDQSQVDAIWTQELAALQKQGASAETIASAKAQLYGYAQTPVDQGGGGGVANNLSTDLANLGSGLKSAGIWLVLIFALLVALYLFR